MEQQGVARAKAQITEVDLVLLVTTAPDLQLPLVQNLVNEVESHAKEQELLPPKILTVVNKVDFDRPVQVQPYANVVVLY